MAYFSYSDNTVVKSPMALLFNVLMCCQQRLKVPDVRLGGEAILDPCSQLPLAAADTVRAGSSWVESGREKSCGTDGGPLGYGGAELRSPRSFLKYGHTWLCQQFLYIHSTETVLSRGDRYTSAQPFCPQRATLLQKTEADTLQHIKVRMKQINFAKLRGPDSVALSTLWNYKWNAQWVTKYRHYATKCTQILCTFILSKNERVTKHL